MAAQRKQFVTEHKVIQASYVNYLGVEEAAKELILYAVGNNMPPPPQKAVHQFWGHYPPCNAQSPPHENSSLDDNSAKAQIQDKQAQCAMGPYVKHQCLPHTPQPFLNLSG